MWRRLLKLFQVALIDFTRNNCHYMAAGIAYWTIFSLFPLALAGIAIMGFLYPSAENRIGIVEGIVELLPVSVDYLAGLVDEVAKDRGALGLVAIIGLIWSGTAVFSAVRKGINHAWHIGRPPHFLLERAIDFVMLLGVGVLALIQVVFATNALGLSAFVEWAQGSSAWVAIKVSLEMLALAVTFGTFMLLYRYVPNTRVTWGDVWLGALVGSALFQGFRIGFAWFVSNFSSFNLVYGSLGSLMAVLVWAYLSSMALIWGAQLAYTYTGVFGSQAGTIRLPEPRPKVAEGTESRGFLGTVTRLAGWLLPPNRTPH